MEQHELRQKTQHQTNDKPTETTRWQQQHKSVMGTSGIGRLTGHSLWLTCDALVAMPSPEGSDALVVEDLHGLLARVGHGSVGPLFGDAFLVFLGLQYSSRSSKKLLVLIFVRGPHV